MRLHNYLVLAVAALLLQVCLSQASPQPIVVCLSIQPGDVQCNTISSRTGLKAIQIDCNTRDCSVFKAGGPPGVLYNDGPGSGFKRMNTLDEKGVLIHIQGLKSKLLAPFLKHVTNLQEGTAAFMSLVCILVFWALFSFLFKDQSVDIKKESNQ